MMRRLMIQGFTEEFTEASPEGGVIYNGRAEPGPYIKARPSPNASSFVVLTDWTIWRPEHVLSLVVSNCGSDGVNARRV